MKSIARISYGLSAFWFLAITLTVAWHSSLSLETRASFIKSLCHAKPEQFGFLPLPDSPAVNNFAAILVQGTGPAAQMGSNALTLLARGMTFGACQQDFIDVQCLRVS